MLVDARSDRGIIIGVTLERIRTDGKSFCEGPSGFGFSIFEQALLHNTYRSQEKKKYGNEAKSQVLVGVMLDIEMGQLSYTVNGQQLGIAFECKELKRGPIWPALSFKNIGACTLSSGIKRPAV